MEQPSAPEVKKCESGDHPEHVDRDFKGEGELKAEDIPLPPEQGSKQEGLDQTADQSLNESESQNIEEAEEKEMVCENEETTPSDSATGVEMKTQETVETSPATEEDKAGKEEEEVQKADESVQEASSEQHKTEERPEEMESNVSVGDQSSDNLQMGDADITQPLIITKEEDAREPAAQAAQDDSLAVTAADEQPISDQQVPVQNDEIASNQTEHVETENQTEETGSPLISQEDGDSHVQQDTVHSSMADQPPQEAEASTVEKDNSSEPVEAVDIQEAGKEEAISEPEVEPVNETVQVKQLAETQEAPLLDTTQAKEDTTLHTETKEEPQQAKTAEDALDALTNMIEHMALTESSAVQPQEVPAKEQTNTVSHETPEEQNAKMEALHGTADLSDAQPPEGPPSEEQQPGASHPEPYRLTQDNFSTEQEMKDAMSAAALAEQDLGRPVSSPSSSRQDPPNEMLHHIKQIEFKDKKVGIVTQNENGPCPLVAILNVLLLRWEIELPPPSEIVSAAKLMEYIGHVMLESVPKDISGEVRLNYEQNMHDAMAVLPKLQTGLDVNVKFTGVREFEYTPECIIFDLLRIPLYHGWLVDPQDKEVAKVVGQAGYNQLVEKVISQKCSENEDQVTEALIIENFLERTASQLTYHGLAELNAAMNEGEIGVLFRNNHFSTIYKHQKELLQLVTDQGFLGESNVVWETLSSIDGDGDFVDSQFRTVPPKPETAPASSSPNTSQLTAEQQIDHDFLVALSLQDEQQPAALQEEGASMSDEEKTTQERADEELARQLQQEEERQAAEANQAATPPQQQPQEPSGARSPQQKKKDNCNIL